jgi:hypothetical protein
VAETAVHDNLSSNKKGKEDKEEDGAIQEPPQILNLNRKLPFTPEHNPSAKEAENDENKEEKANGEDGNEGNEDDTDRMARILARQWYWRGIGIASFVLGVGCLFLSMNLSSQPRYYQRRWSRR